MVELKPLQESLVDSRAVCIIDGPYSGYTGVATWRGGDDMEEYGILLHTDDGNRKTVFLNRDQIAFYEAEVTFSPDGWEYQIGETL